VLEIVRRGSADLQFLIHFTKWRSALDVTSVINSICRSAMSTRHSATDCNSVVSRRHSSNCWFLLRGAMQSEVYAIAILRLSVSVCQTRFVFCRQLSTQTIKAFKSGFASKASRIIAT